MAYQKQCYSNIRGGGTTVTTCDGQDHVIDGLWDLVIAHPPCTYLTVTGNRWFGKQYGNSALSRYLDRLNAIEFFMTFVFCSAKRVAIENPVGIMSSVYRAPDQTIEPYQFGDPARKKTCLWLKNLPALKPTNIVEPKLNYYTSHDGRTKSFSADYGVGYQTPHSERRSKTYPGIVRAMAEQWG